MNQKIKPVLIKVKNNLPRLISAVCICILAFSLFMIGRKLYGYYHDDAKYKRIREQVNGNERGDKFAEVFETAATEETGNPAVSKAPDGTNAPAGTEEPLPYAIGPGSMAELSEEGILLEYAGLKKQNKDLIGWIRIPGFKKEIDYPVMQADDNEYYLKHDFYGNASQAGSIYMDRRNSPANMDRHAIIYGHAMKDMSMFGNLKDFPDKPGNHTKNTKIYIDLLNTRLEYEVFSIYYEHADYDYRQTEFARDEEFLAYIERLRSKSVYDYKTSLSSRDKILTLSTCNNDLGSDIRSVTHARLVRQIVYNDSGFSGTDSARPEVSSREIVSANVYLNRLSLEYGDIEKPQKAKMTPAFSSGIKEFDMEVPDTVETARLVLEKADTEAAIEAVLNGQQVDLNSLKLEYGENILKLKIISRDRKFSRTLTIKVIRNPQPSPTPDSVQSTAAQTETP